MAQHIIADPGTAESVPVEALGPRWPIYTREFAADPWRAYREMRDRYGALVPVELAPGLPATLVIDYRTAITILNDHEHFSADPREWQQNLQGRHWPILPMVEYRPNALRSNGREHDRYREATSDALAGINQLTLQHLVERTAGRTVNTFCRNGSADLLSQYCGPVAFGVVTTILGCTPDLAARLGAASSSLFDGQDADTVNQMFDEALRDLTRHKRADPGADIASRLVQHRARLSDDEMVQQLLTIVSAAIEVPQNLIANTMLLMLTQRERFTAGTVSSLPPSTGAAIDETLFTNPPMANYCLTYPRQPQRVGSVWLPAHQPVVTSMAAINTSSEINTGHYVGNRSHLAFGSGPHACPDPARTLTYLMAEGAIDHLLDLLPELRLAVDPAALAWRPGPFHRALTALPVTFPPTGPHHIP
ncbi:cytochrome P450 [Nocardia abscessus]|uniref:cytochrome P450 n=1 Tax=Nocardia abscessus TaxID=120957 RepID=UPI0002F825B2|nr:cytochrome P450 [Nocardia abscessus]MCC3328275.1 cytochrome P450 [Nocardia abscessus]